MPRDDFHQSRRRAIRRDIREGLAWAASLGISLYFFALFAPRMGLPALLGTRTGAILCAIVGAMIGAAIGWERASRWRRGDSGDHPDFHPVSPIARANMQRSDRWWTLYPLVVGGALLAVVGAIMARIVWSSNVGNAVFAGVAMLPIVFMLAAIPPLERRRCLKRRRQANRCLRCTYALDDVTAAPCPECGHDNSWRFAERTGEPSR